uniref:proline-rich proteoglycan 2-like n=1 Tax=Lonchura striata TaxID=40157 RepID=UPI000B4D1CBB|nr:proline-rich proteoglycan 2-like [Lonchura striata domestica]
MAAPIGRCRTGGAGTRGQRPVGRTPLPAPRTGSHRPRLLPGPGEAPECPHTPRLRGKSSRRSQRNAPSVSPPVTPSSVSPPVTLTVPPVTPGRSPPGQPDPAEPAGAGRHRGWVRDPERLPEPRRASAEPPRHREQRRGKEAAAPERGPAAPRSK